MTDLKQIKCLFEGCSGTLGPDSIVIQHQGDVVGFICDNCQRGPKGFKITLKREGERYVPVQGVPLASVRD